MNRALVVQCLKNFVIFELEKEIKLNNLSGRITGQVRKVLHDYEMICEGDRLAIGLSGGKDSLTLLIAMSNLMRYYPIRFELEAVTIDLGFEPVENAATLQDLTNFCTSLGIRHTIEKTDIGKIVFDYHPTENPCSLCANMRRGALNNVAKRLNCTRVVLAHNRDDAIETMLLSLFYEGRISSFQPVTYLDRIDLHVIRPLIYTEEKDIKAFVKNANLPIIKNPCSANGNTKRQEIKVLIKDLSLINRKISSNIFGAVKRSLFQKNTSG